MKELRLSTVILSGLLGASAMMNVSMVRLLNKGRDTMREASLQLTSSTHLMKELRKENERLVQDRLQDTLDRAHNVAMLVKELQKQKEINKVLELYNEVLKLKLEKKSEPVPYYNPDPGLFIMPTNSIEPFYGPHWTTTNNLWWITTNKWK